MPSLIRFNKYAIRKKFLKIVTFGPKLAPPPEKNPSAATGEAYLLSYYIIIINYINIKYIMILYNRV